MSSSLWYSRRTDPADPTEPAAKVPRGTWTDRPILKRPLPRKGGHKHNPNSGWSQKRSLYQKGREEIILAYDTAHRDQQTAETIATRESLLLDIEKGEVLKQSLRYQRRFDILDRR